MSICDKGHYHSVNSKLILPPAPRRTPQYAVFILSMLHRFLNMQPVGGMFGAGGFSMLKVKNSKQITFKKKSFFMQLYIFVFFWLSKGVERGGRRWFETFVNAKIFPVKISLLTTS